MNRDVSLGDSTQEWLHLKMQQARQRFLFLLCKHIKASDLLVVVWPQHLSYMASLNTVTAVWRVWLLHVVLLTRSLMGLGLIYRFTSERSNVAVTFIKPHCFFIFHRDHITVCKGSRDSHYWRQVTVTLHSQKCCDPYSISQSFVYVSGAQLVAQAAHAGLWCLKRSLWAPAVSRGTIDSKRVP